MSYTFGQLKTDLRAMLFPAGEAPNLVKSHDKFFVDALIDLQTWVDCCQQDNTNLVDQCATFYNCGLTVLDAPRGFIKKVSVIDAGDFCSEIVYHQVAPDYIQRYLAMSRKHNRCLSIPLFFGLPQAACPWAASYPTPTDDGVPKGLPILPLGYHYPQASTDRKFGRAQSGVWAIERGKLYLAPWIQTTETVVIMWDGIKRTWADADPVDDDPLFASAVYEYVRYQHADKFDKDESEAARAKDAYENPVTGKRSMLMRQCREENRVRDFREPSYAKFSPASISSGALFYNDEQSATASCPSDQTGNPVTVTIPAGTVASNISKADANAKAQDEAQTQAKSRLDCQPQATVYANDAQTATAACQGEADAPPPEGNPVTVTIPAGTITSSVSKADANAQAVALAQTQAASQLSCTFWNKAQSYTAVCPTNNAIAVTKSVTAHTYSSTESQSDADQKALMDATNQANEALSPLCGNNTYWNTQQAVTVTIDCITPLRPDRCSLTVNVLVPSNLFSSSIAQADANNKAVSAGNAYGQVQAGLFCQQGKCGTFPVILQ